MAEESKTLFKLLLAVGVLVLYVNLVSPATFTAWDSLQDRLTEGVAWPKFNDPYAKDSISILLVPTGGGNLGSPGSTTGCTNSNTALWECIYDDDGSESFVTVDDSSNNGNFDFGWSTPPTDNTEYIIRLITLKVVCRMSFEKEGVWLSAEINGLLPVQGTFTAQGIVCPVGDAWGEGTLSDAHEENPYTWATFNGGYPSDFMELRLHDTESGGFCDTPGVGECPTIDVTYVELEIIADKNPGGAACGSSPVWFSSEACQIGRAIDIFARGVLFVFEAIVYVISTIVAVSTFIASVTLAIFNVILQVSTFFLAVPGAPAAMQNLIAILFVCILAYVFYLLMKLFRGSE